jgi:malate/lactate dehydrogenase
VSVRDVEQAPPETPDPPGPLTLAAAVRTIVDAIVLDGRRLLPCAVCCHGEHGAEGFATVPVVLGRRGVEEIR